MAKQAGYHTSVLPNPLRTSGRRLEPRNYSGRNIPNPSDDVPLDVSIESAERIG